MPPYEQAHTLSAGQARCGALSLSQWFAEEVQPHEPALRAYLHARFPSLADHDDLVQEAYARLLRARAAGNVRYARAFLFTTARNAALDLFRRRSAMPLHAVTDFTESFVLEQAPGVADVVCQQQELNILAEAVRALPDRCREVIMLRYIDGLSYKEIAGQLGISPETVKVHMAKGMRRCAQFFQQRGLMEASATEEKAAS
jgi:RNA polymerase sigma factor (sigma-70 family)